MSENPSYLDSKNRLRPSRFRLLPITMMMAFLMLGVKVSELYRDGNQLRVMLEMNRAFAEDETPDASEMAQDDEAAAEDEGHEDVAEDGEEGPESVELAKLDEDTPIAGAGNDQREFSQVEIDILQSLAERRDELDERAKEIDLKEKLLEATELRINDKLSEMKNLQTDVEALLEEYNQLEDTKLKSMVKIYESMKPKDASTIFNELDMGILLEVVDRMSERKVAPILAGMDPMKAKEVTEQLAEFRQLNTVPRTLGANQ